MRRNIVWVAPVAAIALILLVWAYEHRRRSVRPHEGPVAPVAPNQGTPSGTADAETFVTRSVLHRDDLKPIEGASVEYRNPKPGLVRTDTAGEARIPAAGPNHIRVRAEGYIGVAQTVELGALRRSVLLDRSGSLELRFVDVDGKPVSGVGLRLIEPGMPFITNHSFGPVVASSLEGVALWPELPAGPCTWRCESEHVLAKSGTPLMRGPKLGERDGVVIAIDDDDLKASFRQEHSVEIRSGERTRLTFEVAKPGVVRGTLVDRRGVPLQGAVVKVMHRFEFEKPKYNSVTFEASSPTKADGSFVIRRAMPGPKRVKGFATPSKGRFLLYHMDFDLALGEDRDLGVLSPLEGHAFEGLVRLGTDEVGVILTKRKALVQISAPTRAFVEGDVRAAVVTEVVEVDVGESFQLEGLPEGRLTLHASPRIEWRPPEGSAPSVNLEFKSSELMTYEVPRDSRAELVLPVIVRAEVSVRLRLPSEGIAPGDRVRIFLIPRGVGAVSPLVQAKLEGEGPEHKGWAVAGEYEVWACSAGMGGASNWFGRAALIVTPGQVSFCEVSIGRGAVIKGRALDASGNPFSGPIVFALDRPGLDKSGVGIHVATPDADGRFTIGGVAPGATLTWAGDQRVVAGGEGTETLVELRAASH